jgi:hypothetical protein
MAGLKKSFENVSVSKNLGMMMINQNNHSVQNLLSSSHLAVTPKITKLEFYLLLYMGVELGLSL